jgi:large subunit ribosomal protein L10
MTGTSFEKYADHLVGTNALLFAYEDPVNPVKALIDYAKSVPKIEIKGAVLAGKALTADQLKELAKMPSRIEMLSMVAGVLNAPIRNLASALANVPRGLVNVLVAVKEQKEKAAA